MVFSDRQREAPRQWIWEFRRGAERELHDIAKHNPKIAEAILRKIRWLAENADTYDTKN